MPIKLFDPLLHVEACDYCPDECVDDGCNTLFAVGNCSSIINDINPVTGAATENGFVEPVDMIFDINSWHHVDNLTSVSFNSNLQIRQKNYIGNCQIPKTRVGSRAPVIEVTFDYCRGLESHCLLSLEGCRIGFMMMENFRDFKPNVSAQEQAGLRYGIARVGAESWTHEVDNDNSRTVTLYIDCYYYTFNRCMQSQFITDSINQVPFTASKLEKKDVKIKC